MPNPINRHPDRRQQPEQRIRQIHPHRMLHPYNPPIPLRVRMDIHVSKQSKQRYPEDEEDRVPDEEEGDA